jgi:hypothetical protein
VAQFPNAGVSHKVVQTDCEKDKKSMSFCCSKANEPPQRQLKPREPPAKAAVAYD